VYSENTTAGQHAKPSLGATHHLFVVLESSVVFSIQSLNSLLSL